MTTCLSARGIIIYRLSYGNTSTIVRCMTREAGLISLMAKGAQRPRSPFLGHIDLFYYVDLLYIPSRNSDLHLLKEIKMLHPHLGLRQSYTTFLTAHYFAELIEAISEKNTPIPHEYELFEKALNYLQETPVTTRVIHRFERRLLEIAGVQPANISHRAGSHPPMPSTDPLIRGFYQLQATVPNLRREVFKALTQASSS